MPIYLSKKNVIFYSERKIEIMSVIIDSITRQGWAASLPLLATDQQPIDSGCAEGAEFTEDGRDWAGRSIRQDLSFV